MNAYTRCLLATSATLLLAFPVAFPASAQTQNVPPQADAVGLDEIVVTAQKRSENLQDVPISMSVFSAQSIERAHALTLGDLQSSAPNFQLTENTGIKTVNIRGVGGGGRNVGFDPRVGIYIDGVYMSNPPAVDSVLLDLDRVEILRGPQGFLFGQNSDAGAVSLVTKAPANESFAKFVASYGNKDALVLSAILNTPLVSDVAFLKVAVARNSRDGFTQNVFNGKFVDDVQDTSGRIQLRLLPSNDLTVDFSLDGSVQKSHFVTGEPRTDTFGAGPPPAPGPFFINANTSELDKNTNIGGSVTIAWQAGDDATLTSISAYRTSKRKWLSDLDHSPAYLSDFVYNDRYKTFSQELRLASSAFDDKLKYIVGAYFQSDADQSSRIVGFGPDIEAVPFGVDRNSKIISLPGVDKTNYALFGSADYKLAATLTLNTGVRVDVSKKSLLLNQDGRTTSGILFSPTVIGYTDNLSETNVTPTIGLNWKTSPDVTIYAKYARGVKGGGFNADFVNGTQPALGALRFAKENVDSFEIGLKSEMFDRSLRFNLAGFYSEYANYQVSQFIQVNGLTSAVIGNAGKVQTYGPELSMQFTPVKGLTLSADGAWLHAKYLSFINGGGIGINYTGNVTEYAPKVTASVAADYTTPTGWGDTDAFLHLAYSYRSSQYTQPSMSPRFQLKSYSLLNGSLGIGSEAQGWQFQIFGKNLTNERYDANLSQDAFGTLIGKRGTPRTYGGEMRLQF